MNINLEINERNYFKMQRKHNNVQYSNACLAEKRETEQKTHARLFCVN